MSYNPNIPTVTDPTLISALQIKSNFQAINKAWSTNHYNLTRDLDFSGMHNSLTFREVSSDTTTLADEVALYTKIVGSIPQLFYRPENNQTPIQLTYDSISTGLVSTNPDIYLQDQYSFIAGPFVVYMGKIQNPTNGQLVNLTPSTTLLYVDITVTDVVGNQTNNSELFIDVATNISGSSFNITYNPTNRVRANNAYYLAIGI